MYFRPSDCDGEMKEYFPPWQINDYLERREADEIVQRTRHVVASVWSQLNLIEKWLTLGEREKERDEDEWLKVQFVVTCSTWITNWCS